MEVLSYVEDGEMARFSESDPADPTMPAPLDNPSKLTVPW
jgi:hypothetical protein